MALNINPTLKRKIKFFPSNFRNFGPKTRFPRSPKPPASFGMVKTDFQYFRILAFQNDHGKPSKNGPKNDPKIMKNLTFAHPIKTRTPETMPM